MSGERSLNSNEDSKRQEEVSTWITECRTLVNNEGTRKLIYYNIDPSAEREISAQGRFRWDFGESDPSSPQRVSDVSFPRSSCSTWLTQDSNYSHEFGRASSLLDPSTLSPSKRKVLRVRSSELFNQAGKNLKSSRTN